MTRDDVGMETLVLEGDEVASHLGIEECIDAVEEAFRSGADEGAPEAHVMGVHVPDGGFHTKAATLRRGDTAYFAAKTNANFPANPHLRGLPTIQGVLALFNAENGRLLAVMDSIRVTELRTAAATAVAARHLARPDASRLTLVGCGAQAVHQIRALAAVRPLRHVQLVDLDRGAAERLAARLSEVLDVSVDIVDDIATALEDSDLCVTCTPSKRPIVTAAMVHGGLFIAGVGADNPEKSELAPDLLAASTVVVDVLDQAASIGDLHHAIVAGALRPEDVHAELGDVVSGRADPVDPDRPVVFDSTGTAIQDVATAALVYERVRERGDARRVRLAPSG